MKDCIENSSSEGSITTVNEDYYPDWETSGTCVNDGNIPAYMSAKPDLWLHATLESCCSKNFSWEYNDCILSGGGDGGTTTIVPLYYPDWENTDTCVNDGNEPGYMTSNHDAWMRDTLSACW